MSILVTGGLGYIGSHTVATLLERGEDVVIVDNLSNAHPAVLERIEQITGRRPTFYQEDVTDRAALSQIFEQESITSVIHFAAYKAVGESVANPLSYYQNNLFSLMTLLEIMRQFDVTRLVFSSSATVYGLSNPSPLLETMPTSATNPYGQTKLMSEQILRDVAEANPDWSIALLRYFNPIGAHESGLIGEAPAGIPNNVMPYLSQVAIGKRERLAIFGGDYDTLDGTGVRDYIHVMDLADGHVEALAKLQSQTGLLTYNLGTGSGTSVLELVQTFERVNQVIVPYQIVERRPGDVPTCFADASKAADELGWTTKRTLEDMCRDTWNWQSKNPNGYEEA